MFPGRGSYTYNNNQSSNGNYRPPPGPPPSQLNYNNDNDGYYKPPPGPPPSQLNYNNSDERYYRPPPGPPPPQYLSNEYSGDEVHSRSYNNESGNYSRPPAPPSQSSSNYQNQNYNNESGSYSRPPVPPSQSSSNYQNQNYNNQQYSRPSAPPPSNYVQPSAQTAPLPTDTQYFMNDQLKFQYSQCSGKKKALLIGINYIGTQNELHGCINDVSNMQTFLVNHFGYNPDDIVVLTDDQSNLSKVPTRENMIRAMRWLVSNAQPNDSLAFHYSGHGGQVEDQDGDEDDGLDDVIYPVDFQTAGPIIDDELHDIMVKPLPQGCRLTALFDSCHSGTVLDLPYTYSTKGLIKEPNIYKELGSEGLQAAISYATGNKQALISGLTNMFQTVTKGGHKLSKEERDKIKQLKFSPADVIMLSGSKDNQTSADAQENGRAGGAMSWAFLTVLNSQSQQTYLTLLQNMRTELSGKYTQKPQLSASHPIDVNLPFIM
ncbi:related to Metacaspase-1 [Saccharomycodes ludwigii]|uniref:Metacaspase-1 n=1 Tax=Saccharomycodes ludwigii TaxID=36035 RepID=A0A376BBB1_9ASCO|nr:hypothetical protein SCDLUD_002128 [Saccharomycodes ludwigii]KAH3902308.1 hypothetical protein SCDLUD_002128 [Saccharomycodes ludwigii]SSD61972.1 related to Metacaspase-1 [Saccharomycodes ludwigii]